MERLYWVAVLYTDHWNCDNQVVDVSEKLLTKYILVSRPAYKKGVGYVYYALFCFFLKRLRIVTLKKFFL